MSFPTALQMCVMGASDTLPGTLLNVLSNLTQVNQGDSTLTMSYVNGRMLGGGTVNWSGGSSGSYIQFKLIAPATTVVVAPGNDGNCILTPIPGGNRIDPPASPGTGTHNYSNPVPIPANNVLTNDKIGQWEHSEPWVGKTTISLPSISGQGSCSLLDFSKDLHIVAKIGLTMPTGTKVIQTSQVEPKWLLPEWQIEVFLHNQMLVGTLLIDWEFLAAVRRTV